MREIMPRLSPGRRKWLERLDQHGPAKRTRGTVGYHCMVLKWTEWNYVDPRTDQLIAPSVAVKMMREGWRVSEINPGNLERITDWGRAVLAKEGGK